MRQLSKMTLSLILSVLLVANSAFAIIALPSNQFSVVLTADPENTVLNEQVGVIYAEVGDIITLTRETKAYNVVNNAWSWNSTASHLDCGAYPEFDSSDYRCEVVDADISAVSITMFPQYANGTEETVESNKIYINSQAEAYDVQFDFADVNSSTDYLPALQWAYQNGIMRGNGSFMRPNDCVDRVEILKMLYKATEKELRAREVGTAGSNYWRNEFLDVDFDQWYGLHLQTALSEQIVEGYGDRTYRPLQCVKRVEAMKMAINMFFPLAIDSSGAPLYIDDKVISDMSAAEWYAKYARGIFNMRAVGTSHTQFADSPTVSRAINFYPDEGMTRKEVAEMIYRLKTIKDNPEMNTYTASSNRYPQSLPLITQACPLTIPEAIQYSADFHAQNGFASIQLRFDDIRYNAGYYIIDYTPETQPGDTSGVFVRCDDGLVEPFTVD